MKRKRRPDTVARCACGKTFRARSLDAVNAQLARHYRKCDVRRRGS